MGRLRGASPLFTKSFPLSFDKENDSKGEFKRGFASLPKILPPSPIKGKGDIGG